MPNYIDDDTALPAQRVERRPVPPGESETKFYTADFGNALLQFCEDARDAIQAIQAAPVVVDGTTITGAGTVADPLVAAGGSGTVVTDGVTITGDGSAEDPLVAVGGSSQGGWTELTQAADQDVTNQQNIDSNTFTFSVTADAFYAIEFEIYASSSNSANDYQFRFALSTGTMLGRGYVSTLNASDVVSISGLSAVAAANTGTIPIGTWTGLTSPPVPATGTYVFKPTANATFKMQFGNNVTGSGIVSRTCKGSRLRWKQIS